MFVAAITTPHTAQIRHDATVDEAAKMVAESANSELLVVDASGALVGTLSEEAILDAMLPDTGEILAIGGSISDAYAVFLQKGSRAASRPIAPLVVRDSVTVGPDAHIAEAAIRLAGQTQRCLPVVSNGRLLGSVSRAAVCRAATHGHITQTAGDQQMNPVLATVGMVWTSTAIRVRSCLTGVKDLLRLQPGNAVSETP